MFNVSRISLSQFRNVFRQNSLKGSNKLYCTDAPAEPGEQAETMGPRKRRVYSGERSVNKVTLLGRVGADAELRGNDSRPVVTFSMATSERYISNTGKYSDVTDWHRIAVFRGGLRDVVLDRVKKGTRVYLTGAVKYSMYQDAHGRTIRGSNIIADDVMVLSESERGENEVDDTEDTDKNSDRAMN